MREIEGLDVPGEKGGGRISEVLDNVEEGEKIGKKNPSGRARIN